MAERLGPSFDHWWQRPYALAVWAWWQLQELDRKRAWVARMDRINNAILIGMAFNEPRKLDIERRSAMASASKNADLDAAAVVARGERLARYIRKGRVLSS